MNNNLALTTKQTLLRVGLCSLMTPYQNNYVSPVGQVLNTGMTEGQFRQGLDDPALKRVTSSENFGGLIKYVAFHVENRSPIRVGRPEIAGPQIKPIGRVAPPENWRLVAAAASKLPH